MPERLRPRPGLAKTRGDRLVRARRETRITGSVGRWKELFEQADVVSEGAPRSEGEGKAWYGTTSLLLPWPAELDAEGRAFAAAVAQKDPHVRLRAVRVACREARVRAPGDLGRASCEVRAHATTRGLRIDVDVQAPLTPRLPKTVTGS